MPAKTHGLSHSRTWNIWQGMHRRCYHKHFHHYVIYGGRGVIVCKRWHKFENFVEDMGICPDGLTIDRIDNDGNYEPNNCRWATYKENNNNRRSNHPIKIFDKEFVTIADACRFYKINQKTFRTRVFQYGWSSEDAVTKQIDHRRNPKSKQKHLDKTDEVLSNV